MSWLNKLKGALQKTSNKISDGITEILHKKKLDETSLSEIEDLLITSDLGVATTNIVISQLRERKFNKNDVTPEVIKLELSSIMNELIVENQTSLTLKSSGLNIILLCGVNGNGKTTTIGKLAYFYKTEGKKVLIAACDTFRAAAKEQLKEWADRCGCTILTGADKQDPASLAYEAVATALRTDVDILFIDTAGRLQNQTNLMSELTKIIKVIKKLDDSAPHHTLLVLDATTGQNAFSQVEHFKESANITGLIVTKLDGTAKAGVLVGVSANFKLPVYFIGIGEGIDDIKHFDAHEFTKTMVGL